MMLTQPASARANQSPPRRSLGRAVGALAIGLLLSGCAAASYDQGSPAAQLLGAGTAAGHVGPRAAGLGSGSKPLQIGPVHVFIRPQPEVELICRLRALISNQRVGPNQRIYGCYVPADKMIVSTADPYVLLHEFKHYFEGAFHSH